MNTNLHCGYCVILERFSALNVEFTRNLTQVARSKTECGDFVLHKLGIKIFSVVSSAYFLNPAFIPWSLCLFLNPQLNATAAT
jgi:hypothetical protein